MFTFSRAISTGAVILFSLAGASCRIDVANTSLSGESNDLHNSAQDELATSAGPGHLDLFALIRNIHGRKEIPLGVRETLIKAVIGDWKGDAGLFHSLFGSENAKKQEAFRFELGPGKYLGNGTNGNLPTVNDFVGDVIAGFKKQGVGHIFQNVDISSIIWNASANTLTYEGCAEYFSQSDRGFIELKEVSLGGSASSMANAAYKNTFVFQSFSGGFLESYTVSPSASIRNDRCKLNDNLRDRTTWEQSAPKSGSASCIWSPEESPNAGQVNNPQNGRVLIIGLKESIVDFDLWNRMNGGSLNAAKVRAGNLKTLDSFSSAGYHADMCLLSSDELNQAKVQLSELTAIMPQIVYKYVVIGNGVRGNPDLSGAKGNGLFEGARSFVLNEFKDAKVVCNTKPDNSLDAVRQEGRGDFSCVSPFASIAE